MRVMYFDGLECIAEEWVCIEHSGWAGEKAALWWSQRSQVPMPDTARRAARFAALGALAEPIAIHLRRPPGAKFPEIARYEMGCTPELTADDVDVFGSDDEDRFYDDPEVPF